MTAVYCLLFAVLAAAAAANVIFRHKSIRLTAAVM